MKQYFLAILLLFINLASSEKTQFVLNRKSNYMNFQFPSIQDEQEAARKGIYSIEGSRNQPPYDIDIQYYSEYMQFI